MRNRLWKQQSRSCQVPGETRERLAAARLVLDFTKSRPASKSEVTIGKAEEFLASLLDESEEETTEHSS